MTTRGQEQHGTHVVSKVSELRALASPVRHQLQLALRLLSPCSIRDLAERIGQKPTALYYHIEILERAGLVVQDGVRGEGVREEALYRPVAKRFRIDHAQRSPRFVSAMAKVYQALLRYAERTFAAAIRNDKTVREGKAAEIRLRQVSVRLSKSSLVRLNGLLDELQETLYELDSPKADATYSVTLCLAPAS